MSKPDIIRTVSSLLFTEDKAKTAPDGEQLPLQFRVPKYQRGYRWTKQQVTDLLKDINDFESTREKQPAAWYCLQPLVVRRNGDKWNLIDGQQRVTTINLILRYLNTRFPKEEYVPLYTIDYETRGNRDWSTFIEDEQEALTNVDFCHIRLAYLAIKKWIETEPGFKLSTFRENLLERCKFIWYDIDQTGNTVTSEEDVFIRLNIGKIPLTNAELIKALFLNRSNFKLNNKDGDHKEELRLRQLEIATQWDAMEEELADNAFWYFIYNPWDDSKKIDYPYPRINYLFEVISGKKDSESDSYATFRDFQKKFDDEPDVDKRWESVYTSYQVLREWFKDHFYYHSIGYLLSYKGSPKSLLKSLLDEYSSKTKVEFKENLTIKIRDTIGWNGTDEIEKSDPKCRKILFLHNVITMQEHKNDSLRFPFYKYHGEDWDIEHIQAVMDPERMPADPEDRKKYLRDAERFISENDGKDLKKDISEVTQDEAKLKDDDAFNKLYERVIQYFEESDVESAKTNTLSNLALLDFGTNRGYGNEVFPVKRETILEKDANGQFIPVCTKNAFLKYYTREDAGDLNRLYERDREAYLHYIKNKLQDYLKKGSK
jgi:hypothetical protein